MEYGIITSSDSLTQYIFNFGPRNTTWPDKKSMYRIFHRNSLCTIENIVWACVCIIFEKYWFILSGKINMSLIRLICSISLFGVFNIANWNGAGVFRVKICDMFYINLQFLTQMSILLLSTFFIWLCIHTQQDFSFVLTWKLF